MADERKVGRMSAYGQLHLRLPLTDLHWLKNEAELYAQPTATVARRIIREARLRTQGKTQPTGVQRGGVHVEAAPTHIVA